MEHKKFVYKEASPMRLDQYLVGILKDYSRSYWTNMIKHHYVLVNGSEQKPGYKLHKSDTVDITWPRTAKHLFEQIPILYEDDNLAILNKPAGLLVHSKGQFNPEYTFANYVEDNFNLSGFDADNDRKGIVHRLDRQTSGAILIAKNKIMHETLQRLFKERKIKKFYIAVTEGPLKKEHLILDVPIARSKSNPKTFVPDTDGKHALTHFYNIESNEKHAVIIAYPESGRTHQIRVHLNYLHRSIIGDTLYGSKHELDGGRFLLHAYSLTFTHPKTGNIVHVVADVPEDMTPYIHVNIKDTIRRLN